MMATSQHFIRWFEDLCWDDIPEVGGKLASLGELSRHLHHVSIRVPEGFAVTVDAFREYLKANDLQPRISQSLADYANGRKSLHQAGQIIRLMFLHGDFPPALSHEIVAAYDDLSRRYGCLASDVAVRSSAIAEDLPEAGFAGQHGSYLNVVGVEALLTACRRCFASLYTDRAIVYRESHHFDHRQAALSVGVQKMVRSDLAGSGVMLTRDPESGFPRVVVVTASWGLGENGMKGLVHPDRYFVFKPLLGNGRHPIISRKIGEKETKLVYSDVGRTKQVQTTPEERDGEVLSNDEILRLAMWADAIERHYRQPMTIEWAKDGKTNELFILQACPEIAASEAVGSATGSETATRIMINLADPESAMRWWKLPVDGIGLAPMELIARNQRRSHPLALTRFDQLPMGEERKKVERLIRRYACKEDYFVENLALGISRLAAAVYPRPVIVRLSDFKADESADWTGDRSFVSHEEPFLLGSRGTTGCCSDRNRDGFALECRAIRQAREDKGFENIIVMVPFCRTPSEADRVLEVMAEHGLRRHVAGLKVYAMIEFPANALQADQFALRFDGLSIGSVDFTEPLLDSERDREGIAALFDGRDESVKIMVCEAIDAAHRANIPIGMCGQATSDYPEVVRFLVDAGITSISVDPDSVMQVRTSMAEEAKNTEGRRRS